MENRSAMDKLVRSFLEFLESGKNYSEHTIESYGTDLQSLTAFALSQGYDRPEQLEREFLRSFIAHLFDQGYSKRSIARKIASIRSFFRFLKRRRVIVSNPALSLTTPRLDKKLPAFIDEGTMERLLDLPDRSTETGCRDAAMLEVFYSTGIRLSELIGLNVGDIDRHGMLIKVTGKGRKQRIVPIGRNAVQSVDAYLRMRRQRPRSERRAADGEPVFLAQNGERIYPQMVGNVVRKYLGKISELEKISPHVLRHTFATHLLNRGADLKAVKELLGHESLSTTQIYTHVTTERMRKVYHQSHPKA